MVICYLRSFVSSERWSAVGCVCLVFISKASQQKLTCTYYVCGVI